LRADSSSSRLNSRSSLRNRVSSSTVAARAHLGGNLGKAGALRRLGSTRGGAPH